MKLRFAASTCLLLLVLAATASASPVGFLGSGSSGTLSATLVSLTWNVDPAACNTSAGCLANNVNPMWNEDVNSGTSLMFAGCPSGTLGVAGCLFATEGISVNNGLTFCGGTNTTTCPGGAEALPVATFLQFESTPNLIFELTGVSAGSSTNCLVNASVTCSIAGSPVVLTPIGTTGTSAAIGFFGIASDCGVAGLSNPTCRSSWTGLFNVTIPNETPAQITADFCPGGVCNPDISKEFRSVAGSFAITIPEPGTVSMILIGVALVTLSQVRKRTRKA